MLRIEPIPPDPQVAPPRSHPRPNRNARPTGQARSPDQLPCTTYPGLSAGQAPVGLKPAAPPAPPAPAPTTEPPPRWSRSIFD
jgi:hypothetical protein